MTDETGLLHRIDKREVRRAFDRAAPAYGTVAVLQREIGARLDERLELVRIRPVVVLDAGSGTGDLADRLARRYPKARLVLLDLAPRMLAEARARLPLRERWRRRRLFVCGDAERAPLATGLADLVVSNLMLQWCDFGAVALELRRMLRPGGLLMFSTFGPDTLRELRASWAAADDHSHVSTFIDMHDAGDALMRAGFVDVVMDREDIVLTYDGVAALMRDLKTLGAHNATAARPRGLTGRGRIERMTAAYEAYRRDGRLPATYEVIHGHCWAPAAPPPRREPATAEVHVPVSELRGRGGS